MPKISKILAKSVEFYTRKTKNFRIGFGLKMTKFVPKKYTAKETPQNNNNNNNYYYYLKNKQKQKQNKTKECHSEEEKTHSAHFVRF